MIIKRLRRVTWNYPQQVLSILLFSLSIPACMHATTSQDMGQKVAETSCSLSVHPPQRIVLPDGSHVLVNATSMAARKDSVLIVGSPFLILDRPGGEMSKDSAIGILRSGTGDWSLVSSPLPSQKLEELQTIPARDGGWHVQFLTEVSGSRPHSNGSAEVWYGHYDGHKWIEVERIGYANAARLALGNSSNLVESDEGLAYAYAFDHSMERQSNAAGNQGIVLLIRGDAGWREDTLPTWSAPSTIQLGTVDGRLRAVYSQSYFADQKPRGPALFAANYLDGWQEPRMVYDPEPEFNPTAEYINVVMMPVRGEHSNGLAWRTKIKGDFNGPALIEWGIIDDEYKIRRWSVTDEHNFTRAAIASLTDQTTVILVRDGGSRKRLKAFAATGDGVQDLGLINVPLTNFVTPIAPMSGERIAIVTGGQDGTPGITHPILTSYFTEIAVECADSRNGAVVVPLLDDR